MLAFCSAKVDLPLAGGVQPPAGALRVSVHSGEGVEQLTRAMTALVGEMEAAG